MNIFYLDSNPKVCAKYHLDKHVVKMCVEYAQLLCSAHWCSGSSAPYKLSHKNHPCSIWVRSSLSNYLWLCDLGIELGEEFKLRYGKEHKSVEVIKWCKENPPNIKDIGFLNPPKAMPENCKVPCTIQSYRNYYIKEKNSIAKWKNRNVPSWFSI